ncbi:MAG: matrixin family metalloprotease [Acidobacteria bacterium]|nr:matrixin family metalloprotease [Acidobacteriota bacterium]
MKSAAIFAAVVLVAFALLVPHPAFSYLPSLTSSGAGPQNDRWDFTAFPVTWNINPSTGSNITGSTAVTDVITASFATWLAAPNATLQVSRGSDSSVSSESTSPANINLICFVCTGDFSGDSQTLAVTMTTLATAVGQSDGHGGSTRFVGQIIKADILFNPTTQYSTDGSSAQDLQTVATHEIGHFLGLGHSAVARAVMFPFASSIRQLSYDDVAGVSLLYPKTPPDVATSSISGTVRLGSGVVFGAHVFAESVTNQVSFPAAIRKSPIGALTAPDGTYTIQGLPPDSYVITAEPLDGPVANAQIPGYAPAYGQSAVQTNFTTRWH